MRVPTLRPSDDRAQTAKPTLNGRASPTGSVALSKVRTRKRESTPEPESVAEETNIKVFVRCRGRNDREILDNSGVVVQTDGVTAKEVQPSQEQDLPVR